MNGTVESRAAAVSAVTAVSTVLSIIFQLVSVPLCLHFWGRSLYGEWLSVFAAAMIFRTVDGGFINYVGNKLNLLYHNDVVALRRTLASSIIGVTILGIAQISVAVTAIRLGGCNWLFGDSGARALSTAPAAMLILVCTWVFSGSFIGIVHRLLIPTGLMYQSAWWSMAYQASVFVGIILAASMRLGLVGASAVMAFVQAGVYISSAFYIRFRLPAFLPWLKSPNWRIGIRDLAGSLIFMVSGVLQQIATSGMALFVTGIFGAASLPTFTTVRTVANLWTNVTNTLSSPLLPDIIRYHTTGQARKLLTLVDAHIWLLSSIVNIGIVATYPLLVVAYRYWTRGQIALDIPLTAALLASVVFSNSVALINVYLAGANDARSVLSLSAVRAAVSLGVAGISSSLGIVSAGIGVAAAEFACMVIAALILFPSLSRRIDARQLTLRSPWPVASMVAAVAFLVVLGFTGKVGRVAFGVTVVVMVCCSAMGWRMLDHEVRARLRSLVKRLVTTRSGA